MVMKVIMVFMVIIIYVRSVTIIFTVGDGLCLENDEHLCFSVIQLVFVHRDLCNHRSLASDNL